MGRIACAQNFPDSYLLLPGILNDPFCCMTLLAIERSLLQRTLQRRRSDGCTEFEWPGKPWKIAPFRWKICTHT